MRTVSEVAALAGVTVRTLHHYDEIGLLRPSGRTEAGYRLYARQDLLRLQEILGWRRLGFPLAEVQALLDDPDHDRREALRRQRELVAAQLDRLTATARALDAALQEGAEVKEETMFEGFDPGEYEEEVRERWGDTEAYRESQRRTAAYGEAEWRAIEEERRELLRDYAALLEAGEDPAGEQARAVAERDRRSISRWFYDLSPEMHRGLAEMYVADERFGRHYEERAKGLAAFVRAAVVANAEAAPAD